MCYCGDGWQAWMFILPLKADRHKKMADVNLGSFRKQ